MSLTQPLSDVSSSLVIHIVAHLFNLERYHLGQAKDAEGLLAALSKLGDAPNESYLNPVRTFYMVSQSLHVNQCHPCGVISLPIPISRAIDFKSFT